MTQFGGDGRLLYIPEIGTYGGGAHIQGQYSLVVFPSRIRTQRVSVIACFNLTGIEALYFILFQ